MYNKTAPLQMRKTIVANIKAILEGKERNVYWLSKHSGITQPTLSQYMNYKRTPTIYNLWRIAGTLHVTVDRLFMGLNRSNIDA